MLASEQAWEIPAGNPIKTVDGRYARIMEVDLDREVFVCEVFLKNRSLGYRDIRFANTYCIFGKPRALYEL